MSPAVPSSTASSSTIVHSSRLSRSARSNPADPPRILVDVELVVGTEPAERHPEQAEDADLAGAERQSQRAHAVGARIAGRPLGTVAQPREVAEGSQVRDARRADAAGPLLAEPADLANGHRHGVTAPSPGGSGGGAVRAPRRVPGTHRPWSSGAGGSASRRPAPGGMPCASTFRWRTATGPAVVQARHHLDLSRRRVRSTGARMKTAWTGVSPSIGTSRSASKESSCRPNALRLTEMSSSGRTGSSPSDDLP